MRRGSVPRPVRAASASAGAAGRLPLAASLLLLSLGLLLPTACRPTRLSEPVDLVLPRADDGKPFSFAARRGEATIVYFFSTWCVPCQAMEPGLAEVARIGKAEGIEVVGVSLDREGRRTTAPYVWGTKPPYPVVVGGGDIAAGDSPFGFIPEIPAVLILDGAGRPAASISGVAGVELLLSRAREVKGRR